MSLSFVFTLTAWITGALGAGLLAWSLFADRPRSRVRCPRCWYNMAQAVPDAAGLHTCPECGRSQLTDRALRRTRRRWRWATLAGLLLLVAPMVVQIPEIQRRGWLFLIPDRVLFHAIALGGYEGAFGKELQRRLGASPWPNQEFASTLTPSRRAVLLRRAESGTFFARPISQAWRDSYGAMIRAGTFFWTMNPQDRDTLLPELESLKKLPYEFTVRTRGEWPADMPPSVEFDVEHWWPFGVMDNIAGIDWTTSGGATGHSRGGRGQFSLPIRDTGNVTVNMQIDLEQEEYGPPRKTRPIARESRSISYTTVESIDDILTPVSSEEVDAALRTGFKFVTEHGGSLRPDAGSISIPNCDDVAFAFVIELSHNGRRLMTAHARWLGSSPKQWTFGNVDSDGDWPTTAAYIQANAGAPGWTVHLTEDPAWALAVLDAQRYWKGDLTFPTTVTARGAAVPIAPAK